MPDPIMERARSMVPQGFELVVTDSDNPDFLKTVAGAEYYVGFPRAGMGPDFFKAAPGLKLIQLISAGYDRLDLAAAKNAGVPIANNGGSNSVAVAEHTMMLILAVYKKLSWHHDNVVHCKRLVGDFSETRTYELACKTLGILGPGTIDKKAAHRSLSIAIDVTIYCIARSTKN